MESNGGQVACGGMFKLQERNLGFDKVDVKTSRNCLIDKRGNSINGNEVSAMGRPLINFNNKNVTMERSGILNGDIISGKPTINNNGSKNNISERSRICSRDCINTKEILRLGRPMINHSINKSITSERSGICSGDWVNRNEIIGVGRQVIDSSRSKDSTVRGTISESWMSRNEINYNGGGFMIGVGVGKNKKSKRLSIEQVKALERAFKVGNRLGVQRKGELAREVGLHGRQVAVWFQNKRARCKTKQIENEFEALKKHAESLEAHRHALSLENATLKLEVASLKKSLSMKENMGNSSDSSSTILPSDEYSSLSTPVLEEATQYHCLAWDVPNLWTPNSHIDPILSILSP